MGGDTFAGSETMFVKAKQQKPRQIRTRLDEERLTELLDVATEVFIAEGFSAASTNEIARRANSSKTTFYSRFPTKEQLFNAVIQRRMTGIFQAVAAALPENPPIEQTLHNFGSALIRLALSEDQIKLVRVVSMESAKFPELGKRFYKLGPKRGEEDLAEYFKRQIERGRLPKDDTRQMAQHVLSLITGGPVNWYVLGFEPSPLSKNSLRKHLNSAVRTFLKAYGSHSGA
jgi:TetR/AcrR family transcriptional regulator of autoinduction and epiphytic fitness